MALLAAVGLGIYEVHDSMIIGQIKRNQSRQVVEGAFAIPVREVHLK